MDNGERYGATMLRKPNRAVEFGKGEQQGTLLVHDKRVLRGNSFASNSETQRLNRRGNSSSTLISVEQVADFP